MFRAEPVLRKTFRFADTAAATAPLATFDVQDLSRLWMMAATTTLLYSVYTAYRIIRVTVWGAAATLGVPATVALEWTGAPNQSLFAGNAISDSTLSPYEYARVTATPPVGSGAAFWQNVATAGSPTSGLFQLAYPANAIIQIEIDLVMITCQAAATNNGQRVAIGATVGTLYVPNLATSATITAVPPFNSIA
jgi:hypothetical protein